MTRDRLAWLLLPLVLAVAAWWVSANTEWVDDQIWHGPQGEAQSNPVYAFEQVLRRLGMKVEHRDAFDPLPAAGARLLLLSDDWQLIPGRSEALHQWVLRGGHLVVTGDFDNTALEDWIPVTTLPVAAPKLQTSGPLPGTAASGAARPMPHGPQAIDLLSTPPLWDGTEHLGSCLFANVRQRLRVKPGLGTNWSLTRASGAEALRVPLGRGSVTVLNVFNQTFFNRSIFNCDNSLILAAALQAEPGASGLIYLNEKREALLPWLWHQGWPAVVAGLLGLTAALWRSSVRFGPRVATPPRLRRSIAEQVQGLAHYLQREGREALLLAQQRALHEAATRRLPGYRALPPAQRAPAIAAATALDLDALSTALNSQTCRRIELSAHLHLLESARRLLNRIPEEKRSS